MIHLGDVTKIDGSKVEPVDCITFGSPCQDLSVAGKRAGLDGARSGLFVEAVRIIREMREHDRANGRADDLCRPRFAVWENVSGALSSPGGKSAGEDFRVVLEELAGLREPGAVIPRPEKRWAKAGCIAGDGWSIAWRQLDAQYWGVPQRRKRIALVVDFGGQCAGEVLFEQNSVSGNPYESIPPWKGVARYPAESTGGYDSVVGRCPPQLLKIRSGRDGGGKGALVQVDKSATLSTLTDQTLFQPIPINEMVAVRHQALGERTGLGIGKEGSPAYTISTKHPHMVCHCIGNGQANQSFGDKAGALNCMHDQQAVCYTPWDSQTNRVYGREGVWPSLQAREKSGLNREAVLTYDARGNGDGKTVCTITGDHESHVTDYTGLALERRIRWIVRRLTPLECERLQGFPDGWTDIGEWVDSKGKKHKPADSPRYKALGNSIALPQWWWLVNRMKPYLPAGATLGSLFDGIGGFPLVWEECYGKGTARWASEIEEFPIAVTKIRFKEKEDEP